jgi:hypothetical protein
MRAVGLPLRVSDICAEALVKAVAIAVARIIVFFILVSYGAKIMR